MSHAVLHGCTSTISLVLQARLEESERDGAKDSEEDFAGTLHAGLLI